MKRLLNKVFDWKKYLQRSILLLAVTIFSSQMIVLPASATGVYQIPKVTPGDRPWVIDQAEVISRVNEGKISSDLEKLAKETGNEVRIVTIRRFDYGDTAESFTKALFEKWFPTPEVQANQTLLVIDTLSSGTAIRSGDTAKARLSDDIAQSVVDETILAPLKEGEKYNQAFLDASDRLVAVLAGKPDPGPPQIASNVSTKSTFKSAEETDTGNATVWVIGLLLAATIIPMATYYFYVR
ncbi:photosystem II repair protein Psb32 [Aliterella atlantica]|uniref:Beta-propeller domain-containing protein, methanol dehydrogenase n=1 Tax=Aliterella atlantica CENA595 TaxID=1618023 RepID=A0A0D8ZSH1_9CYAN|nr:TPM domain-containing protein [Aliterella atlantica]KJH71459.1 beta-propeller domain-containing protein, methanol dehydrogenase [Aliterella atlantica CENA595]